MTTSMYAGEEATMRAPVYRTGPWRLCANLLLCGFLAAHATGCGAPANQDVRTISPAEADSLIAANRENPGFVLLDIRTPSEYETARIDGAISYDLMTGTFPRKIGSLDRTKTYLLYCNDSHRSTEAIGLMKDRGFLAVYQLEGGLLAWAKAGYLVKRQTPQGETP